LEAERTPVQGGDPADQQAHVAEGVGVGPQEGSLQLLEAARAHGRQARHGRHRAAHLAHQRAREINKPTIERSSTTTTTNHHQPTTTTAQLSALALSS
jgi:hypothetical protein